MNSLSCFHAWRSLRTLTRSGMGSSSLGVADWEVMSSTQEFTLLHKSYMPDEFFLLSCHNIQLWKKTLWNMLLRANTLFSSSFGKRLLFSPYSVIFTERELCQYTDQESELCGWTSGQPDIRLLFPEPRQIPDNWPDNPAFYIRYPAWFPKLLADFRIRKYKFSLQNFYAATNNCCWKVWFVNFFNRSNTQKAIVQ